MISESPCGPLLFRLPVVGPGGLIQLSLAKCATEPYAENPRIVNASTRTASIIILTSFCSIFLPRYSGVRPTIKPAMNTAKTANISIPYKPEPTPPKTTSPSSILQETRHLGRSVQPQRRLQTAAAAPERGKLVGAVTDHRNPTRLQVLERLGQIEQK